MEERSHIEAKHCATAGGVQWQPPAPPRQLRGGVLADEMGLGKTVVCLALILRDTAASRARPGRGGTLVAATPALMGQWEAEVGAADTSTCRVSRHLVAFLSVLGERQGLEKCLDRVRHAWPHAKACHTSSGCRWSCLHTKYLTFCGS